MEAEELFLGEGVYGGAASAYVTLCDSLRLGADLDRTSFAYAEAPRDGGDYTALTTSTTKGKKKKKKKKQLPPLPSATGRNWNTGTQYHWRVPSDMHGNTHASLLLWCWQSFRHSSTGKAIVGECCLGAYDNLEQIPQGCRAQVAGPRQNDKRAGRADRVHHCLPRAGESRGLAQR
jgi:hypothetical protein